VLVLKAVHTRVTTPLVALREPYTIQWVAPSTGPYDVSVGVVWPAAEPIQQESVPATAGEGTAVVHAWGTMVAVAEGDAAGSPPHWVIALP